MTIEFTREQLATALDYADLYEDSLRTDYFGRAMYNDTCVGIVGSIPDGIKFAVALARILTEAEADPDLDVHGTLELLQAHLEDLLNCLRTDSMGHDVITYFAGVKVQAP